MNRSLAKVLDKETFALGAFFKGFNSRIIWSLKWKDTIHELKLVFLKSSRGIQIFIDDILLSSVRASIEEYNSIQFTMMGTMFTIVRTVENCYDFDLCVEPAIEEPSSECQKSAGVATEKVKELQLKKNKYSSSSLIVEVPEDISLGTVKQTKANYPNNNEKNDKIEKKETITNVYEENELHFKMEEAVGSVAASHASTAKFPSEGIETPVITFRAKNNGTPENLRATLNSDFDNKRISIGFASENMKRPKELLENKLTQTSNTISKKLDLHKEESLTDSHHFKAANEHESSEKNPFLKEFGDEVESRSISDIEELQTTQKSSDSIHNTLNTPKILIQQLFSVPERGKQLEEKSKEINKSTSIHLVKDSNLQISPKKSTEDTNSSFNKSENGIKIQKSWKLFSW